VHADAEIHASMAARIILSCHETSNAVEDIVPHKPGCNMIGNRGE